MKRRDWRQNDDPIEYWLVSKEYVAGERTQSEISKNTTLASVHNRLFENSLKVAVVVFSVLVNMQ